MISAHKFLFALSFVFFVIIEFTANDKKEAVLLPDVKVFFGHQNILTLHPRLLVQEQILKKLCYCLNFCSI